MAFTKQLEVRVDGTKLLWQIDYDGEETIIKDVTGFEMTSPQLKRIRELVDNLVEMCKMCPDVTSFEYSDIV